MSAATENFEAGVAALGLLDGGHADHQQAMRYFTAASDLDPAMCDAWLGRMLCGDNASGTMYRAWRARQQMHAQVSRMGIAAAQLWPRFDIGMGIVALEQPIYDQSALAAALASSLAMGNPPDYAEAIDALAEATPTSVTAWVKAAIYYRAQRWPDVIDTLSEHRALFDRDAVLKVAVELALGIAHAYLGQFDKAAGYLRTVSGQTTLSEAVPVAQWFSALIARERGNEDSAKDLMRKVNAAAPSPEVSAALEDKGIRLQLTTVEAIAERTDPWDPRRGSCWPGMTAGDPRWSWPWWWDPSVGWGVVDPLAALTWNVADPAPTLPVNNIIHPAPPPHPPDYTPRRTATYLVLGIAGAIVLAIGAWAALRRKSHP